MKKKIWNNFSCAGPLLVIYSSFFSVCSLHPIDLFTLMVINNKYSWNELTPPPPHPYFTIVFVFTPFLSNKSTWSINQSIYEINMLIEWKWKWKWKQNIQLWWNILWWWRNERKFFFFNFRKNPMSFSNWCWNHLTFFFRFFDFYHQSTLINGHLIWCRDSDKINFHRN